MSSPPGIPPRLAHILAQNIKGAIRDPAVYESNVLMDDLSQAIRTYVAEVLSSERARRNADKNRKGFRVLMSDDVLPLIMERMPVADVFAAARVCSKWRDITLSCSRLWTYLEVRATQRVRTEDDIDEDGDEDYVIVSNLSLLKKILPRSAMQPLTLAVDAATPPLSLEFLIDLQNFMELVAPRLLELHIETRHKQFLENLLYDTPWDFPMLRRLAYTVPGTARIQSDYWPFDLSRIACPALTHLDLGTWFQLVGVANQPALTHLRTRVKTLQLLAPLLSAMPALECLEFTACIVGFMVIDRTKPKVDSIAALSAVPDVRLRIKHEEVYADYVLMVFHHLDCTRLVLEFVECEESVFRGPILGGRWSHAVQIVLRDTPGAVEIVVTDASRRTLTLWLLDEHACGEHTQCVDWECVQPLGALTALRVDASLWCLAMHNFPRAPLLADTTLVLDGADGLDAVMIDGVAVTDRQPIGSGIRCGNLWLPPAAQHGREVEPGSYEVPPVPTSSSLTLSSDVPVLISGWGVEDVKKRLSVERVILDGVSMGRLPST